MHIPLLNFYIGWFLEDLKLQINWFLISAQQAAWPTAAQWLFSCELQEALLYLKIHILFSPSCRSLLFFSAVIPFVSVPIPLNSNEAVYSSAIWVTRRINSDTKVSLSTATLKAAPRGILHTHTGYKIKIRSPPNLYSETQVWVISSPHLYLVLL